MVMRKLGPCQQPGCGTGIKFLITSQIMIYPQPNGGALDHLQSVQFQSGSLAWSVAKWGQKPKVCDSNVKTHFSGKKSTV